MKTSRFYFELKTLFAVLFMAGVFIVTPHQAEAQFLQKLKNHAEKKIKQEAEKRAERRVDKKIDKTFDAAEDVLDGKKKNESAVNEGNGAANKLQSFQNNQSLNQENQQKVNKPDVVWSQFDFVPGDQVIFDDAPSADERNGEFPSRWDLVKGQVEIARVDGENVLMFIDGNPSIVPYLKNANEDYLPDVFTIEFDFYKPVDGNRISVYLYDDKNQKHSNSYMYMDISSGRVSEKLSEVSGELSEIDYKNSGDARWIHVSIAFTKGKLKVYMDATRVINIPHYEGNPTGLSLEAYFADLGEDKAFYFKNIRIAKGGVKYYSRVLSEGKIIVNGIKFDVNKATLRPESMGPINEIIWLMESNPEINFSIEGHTDSDGNADANQALSEARAKSVMEQMIAKGIDPNRLKSTGWGESKPIDNNQTAEGKANNRRVEFVKFNAGASTNSQSDSNPEYDKLNNNNLASQLDNLPDGPIHISNNQGIVTGPGSIIVYATSDGNLGKMQILDVDKNDNYKLTLKYVTYNADGSVHSQSNHLEVKGTYSCDLDKGNAEDMIQSEIDFQLGRQDKNTTTIYSGETAILKVYSK